MDLAELCVRLQGLLEERLSPRRVRHSLGVADYAARLCARHGIDPLRGRVAGLAHDLCKEMDLAEQEDLASIYSRHSRKPLKLSSVIAKAAMHGPAAAGLLLRDYAFADEDILEALACHTIGGLDLGPLALLIYAADKLEPGRGHVDDPFRASCESLAPEQLFRAVLGSTVSWLRREGLPIAEETLRMYNCDLPSERQE